MSFTASQKISVGPVVKISMEPSTAVAGPDYVLVYPAQPHESLVDMFLSQVEEVGLKVERRTGFIGSREVVFVLLRGTREALAQRAEDNKLVVTLHCGESSEEGYTKCRLLRRVLSWVHVPQLTGDYTKARYKRSMDRHFTHCTTDCISRTGVRSMLVHDILKDVDIRSSGRNNKYRGLLWLKEKGYIIDSFVPHNEGEKKVLLARLGGVTHTMSMTAIRDYLGEKVAFIFAWRSAWLSRSLLAPILFGLIVLLYGIFEANTLEHPEGPPQGAKETYERFIDNNVTPYYAFFMCFWAIYFSDIWRKFKHMYAFKWGVMNYHMLQERERVKYKKVNRSKTKKMLIRMVSISVGTLLLLLSAVYCLAIAYIEEAFAHYLTKNNVELGLLSGRNIANIAVSILNGVLVMFVNFGMEKVAYKLTEIERYRYHSDFENALTWRVFIQTFINNNSRILMMLIIPRFSIYNIFTNSKVEIEFCKEGHCLFSMSTQIIVFLLVKPITGCKNYIWYLFMRWCKSQAAERPRDGYPRVVAKLEQEYALFRGSGYGERYYTLEDMNDRIAQYGFVVMYAAAFPFAPLIAFVIECMLRKADIHRYVCQQRRPVPRRYEGVGCWEEILDFVNMAAICTNIFIIAFRSYHGRLLFIDWVQVYGANEGPWRLAVYLQTSILLLTCALRAMFQYISIPESVRHLSREEENKAKEFVKNHQCLD